MKKADRKETLAFYKSMLPYGATKAVAEKAGVTTQAVRNFLKGINESERVENAILDVIAELQAERNKRLKKIGILL